jgi:hypothetical protein
VSQGGGPINIIPGVATDGATGPAITITGGTNNGIGFGGNVSLLGGPAGGTSGDGGIATVKGGLGANGANDNGGALVLSGGDAHPSATGDSDGGAASLVGGLGIAGGEGGAVAVTGGKAGATGTDGGAVNIKGGDGGATSGLGGDLTLEGGDLDGSSTPAENGIIEVRGALGYEIQAGGTVTSATDFDPDAGLMVHWTFGAAATAEVGFTACKTLGVELTMEITNGGQGTLTWGVEVDWAGGVAPTLTAAGVDLLKFYTRDGGASWIGWTVALDIS